MRYGDTGCPTGDGRLRAVHPPRRAHDRLWRRNAGRPQFVAAVSRICTAGKSTGRAIGIFLPRMSDVPGSREQGASLFILGSDLHFLLAEAAARGTAIRNQGAAARTMKTVAPSRASSVKVRPGGRLIVSPG